MKEPVGAVSHPLESIADIRYGFTAKACFEPVGPKFLRITDIQDGIVDWDSVPYCEAPKKDLEKFQLSPGEIVFARTGATTGKSYLIRDEVDAVFASYLIRVKPVSERIFSQYLAYYFQTADYWADISAGTEGAAQGGFNATKLGQLQVPIPPVDEQKRIVAMLDQAFAALDRARAHAEANLADTRLLFESAVDELICRNRHDWQEGAFEQLVGDVFTGPFGSILHKSDYIEGGTPIVNPSNIMDGRIEPDWTKTVSNEAVARLTFYKLRVGDLVIGRRGEMGRCAPVLEHMEGWICGTGSFVIRPKPDVSSEFVACVVRTPTLVEKLTSISTGATMPNLSNRTLAQMPFALPSHEEQLDMLAAINQLEGRTKALHFGFELKLSELSNLRQFLLQKAFSGNLT